MGKQRWLDGITRSIEGMLAAAARAPVGFADAESVRVRLGRIDDAWERATIASGGASDAQIAAVVVAETFGATRPGELVLEEHIGAVSTAGRAVSAVLSEVGEALELEDRVAAARRDAAAAVREATDGLPESERSRLEESVLGRVARAAIGTDTSRERLGIEAVLAAEAEARRIESELALERSRDEELARTEREREENEGRKLELIQLVVLGMTLAEALELVRSQDLNRDQERKRDEELRLELERTNHRSRGLSMEMTF